MTIPPPAWPRAPEIASDPAIETLRLNELLSLKLLDTPPEYRFDRVTRLAADFFRVPTAYVAFLDDQRQWIKSQVGGGAIEMPRCLTFCQYTITHDEPLVILNALDHPIGRNHPWVVGEPGVRFYAGVPLAGPTGKKIGTFCLVDTAPRQFSPEELASLIAFAALVEREINLGEIIQTQSELLQARHQLIEAKLALEHEMSDAARYVRQMIPPPLDGAQIIDWHFHPSAKLGGDGLGYRIVSDDLIAFYMIDVTGHGLGAALLAVTALELLRNPAAQVAYAQPAAVIERLNRSFPMQDHGGKFFSAWYGVYSHAQQTLTYANAGHPPALILTRENGKARLERTAPGTSVLGVTPTIAIREVTIPFPPTSELCLFTDGLYELLDPQGGRGSYDEFVVYLQKALDAGHAPWPAINSWHKDAHDKKLIDDDVSLLRFATRDGSV